MIQLIVGNKGKGKTKCLHDKVNKEIKSTSGNIVYLDKNAKHMYVLNNKVRLIDTSAFPITNSNEFIGFIYGIISQDNDIEQMYFDSFLKIARLESTDIGPVIEKLEKIGEQYNITFILSISIDEKDLPDIAKEYVLLSL